jgi:antitoxin YefM
MVEYRNPVQLRKGQMETTYSSLRENLASVLDKVIEDQEVVIVRRKGSKDVALVPADELSGLIETAHLLRSPRNAQRLLTALQRARSRKVKPSSVERLRRDLKIDQTP